MQTPPGSTPQNEIQLALWITQNFGLAAVAGLVLVAVIVAASTWLGKHFAGKAVDHRFDQRLAEFETQLAIKLEQARESMVRERAHYQEFLGRRFRAYQQLNSLLLRAEGGLSHGVGFGEVVDYTKASQRQVKELLEQYNLPWEEVSPVLIEWDLSRENAEAALHKLLDKAALAKARRDTSAFRNRWLQLELYCSDSVQLVLDNAWQTLSALRAARDHPQLYNGVQTLELRNAATAAVQRATREMRHELSAIFDRRSNN